VLADLVRRRASRVEERFSADDWLSNYLIPATNAGFWAGSSGRVTEVQQSLPAYAAMLRGSPPAFAAQMVRAMVLSQARFTFRTRPSGQNARKTFGTRELSILERPWPNATTGELITRMEWHAGLAGNAYVVRQPSRLRVLRPDWVAIVYGSDQEPEDAAFALDGEIIGYVYANGGLSAPGDGSVTGWRNRIHTLLPDEVAHWSPLSDPEGSGIGMSWLTPAIRDIQSDKAATEHKVRFFTNGATPNLVVKGLTATTKPQFDELVEMMDARLAGVANAYRTLYLTAGADATVVSPNFRDMDLKSIQGAGETRIAVLSRVPAPILNIAEGLSGASLNAGNLGQSRRNFADSWIYPTLQDLSATLSSVVNVPSDAELWADTTDMPILREDAKDAAEIEDLKATTVTKYVREGFTAESSIAAVRSGDISLLKHTGYLSVQVQKPGEDPDKPEAETPLDLTRPGK
jgi:phage portal protein BeeE